MRRRWERRARRAARWAKLRRDFRRVWDDPETRACVMLCGFLLLIALWLLGWLVADMAMYLLA